MFDLPFIVTVTAFFVVGSVFVRRLLAPTDFRNKWIETDTFAERIPWSTGQNAFRLLGHAVGLGQRIERIVRTRDLAAIFFDGFAFVQE